MAANLQHIAGDVPSASLGDGSGRYTGHTRRSRVSPSDGASDVDGASRADNSQPQSKSGTTGRTRISTPGTQTQLVSEPSSISPNAQESAQEAERREDARQNHLASRKLRLAKQMLNDHQSPITAEAYVQLRLLPVLKEYKAKLPHVYRRKTLLQITAFGCTAGENAGRWGKGDMRA